MSIKDKVIDKFINMGYMRSPIQKINYMISIKKTGLGRELLVYDTPKAFNYYSGWLVTHNITPYGSLYKILDIGKYHILEKEIREDHNRIYIYKRKLEDDIARFFPKMNLFFGEHVDVESRIRNFGIELGEGDE